MIFYYFLIGIILLFISGNRLFFTNPKLNKKEEVINKPGSVLDDHLSRIIITNNFKRFLEV